MIPFELFDKTLRSIQNKDERICEISEVLGGAEELFAVSAIDEVLCLLTEIFSDTEEWIFCWVWELQFGEKWMAGMVEIDERPVKLHTTLDLYKLLMGEPVYEVQ